MQRFAHQQANRRYLHARTREGLGRLYAMHWPHLQPHTARNVRRTPLHDRVDAAGAVFGEIDGLRARELVRAARHGRASTSTATAARTGSSRSRRSTVRRARPWRCSTCRPFTKVEVAGPDALRVVQQVCTQDLDVRVGRVVYTLMLNARGGIELDGTVTRLADDRFLVITPTASHQKTLALLRRRRRGPRAPPCSTPPPGSRRSP